MNPPISRLRHRAAFTMIELMIVITIIGILAAMAFPAYRSLTRLAQTSKCIKGLQHMTTATMTWAAEHGDRLPSPRYAASDPGLPDYWKLDTDGEEGLWLNGVVYAQLYLEDAKDAQPGENGPATGAAIGVSDYATAGKHLVGTVFESAVSINVNRADTDWYRHSYAMNANLMYDEIAKINGVEDPWLTEKALSKFEPVRAMLYIDCIDQNIVMASERSLVIDAAEKRYEGKHLLAAFLDGHVEKVKPKEVPEGDPEADRDASLFWRGILPER